ncbi:MAG: hypothetical protein U0798_21565 [Gemmataceae bacterium]
MVPARSPIPHVVAFTCCPGETSGILFSKRSTNPIATRVARGGIAARRPQALALLNDQQVLKASVAGGVIENDPDPVMSLFRRVLGRRSTAKEAALAADFLQQSPLSELCRAMFNTNEFVYVD